MKISIKIVLVGNLNCGRTTLFNSLTGFNQFVGNWPDVTVEKKENRLRGNKDVIIMDLPDIYSLSPYTLEEMVAGNYLITEHLDVILSIMDGTNLERNLYLTTQLMELGIPVLMAVSMMDVVKKSGDQINIQALSRELDCPMMETSTLRGTGIIETANKTVELTRDSRTTATVYKFSADAKATLEEIERCISGNVPEAQKRFYAIKLFERDDKIAVRVTMVPDMESIIAYVEDAADDDAGSIIIDERYAYTTSIIGRRCTKKSRERVNVSDKIDHIVTNRFLALPIFAAVMWVVCYVSVITVGT